MSLPLRITSVAHRDIADAATWYESRQDGLGQRFFSDVDTTVRTIAERPQSFPDVYRGLRRAQLKDFRYGVFYLELDREIVIVGVIDLRRNPEVWRARRRSL